jgi:serine/threonine protein phosphatase 1
VATSPAPRDRDRFARLRGARRVWAVASVHGEAARLAALHDRLWSRFSAGDRLVYLGNIVGCGPDSLGAVAELLSFRRAVLARPGGFSCDVAVLRGAQEEMWHKLLQLQFASNPREVLVWMLAHGVGATLAAYGIDPQRGLQACREGALGLTRWNATLRAAMHAEPGHTQLMAALRRAALADKVLFVHAGIDASRPLDAQGDAFWWARGRFLESEPFPGFARVVRGFDPRHPGLVETAHAVSLDGGSGFGGPLLAACFDAEGGVVDRLSV